ncbi:MAG: methionine--tRNA ligase, partial [Bradyrhizobium sp.]
ARFVADVNKDLADIFGNLANRIISFAHRAFDGRIPEGGAPGDAERQLAHDPGQRSTTLHRHHTALEFRAAAATTRAVWDVANAYLQPAAPWTEIQSDPARAAVVTRIGLNLVALCATLAWSIVPHLAARVLGAFGRNDAVPRWPSGPLLPLLDDGAGTPVARLGPLVEKISPEKADHLTSRFGV